MCMRSTLIDMAGKTFTRWSVLHQDASRQGVGYWVCKCVCGNEKSVSGYALRSGQSRSCGCLHYEECANRRRTHGLCGTPTHIAWASMKQRCFNTKSGGYPTQGGRGIQMCSRWMKFENFYEDLGERPPEHVLDRFNHDEDYSPENCMWTVESQSEYRSSNGYCMIKVGTDHVLARKSSCWIAEHRVLMWDVHGYGPHFCAHCGTHVNWLCKAPDRLVIDHVDENKANNSISNLAISCHSCNLRMHSRRMSQRKQESIDQR